jgi:hypothetical protein
MRPGGAENFSPLQRAKPDPGAHATSYPMGTGESSPMVKRPGREADHSPASSAEVKECVDLYLHPNTSSRRSA